MKCLLKSTRTRFCESSTCPAGGKGTVIVVLKIQLEVDCGVVFVLRGCDD